jgi:predicted PurR-regulated permease PerM
MAESAVRRITWRNADIARILLLGMLFMFLWHFFWMVYSAVFVALIAVLLAIVLHAPARLLARWMPFRLSFTLVVLSFIIGFGLLMVAIIPQILHQFVLLSQEVPEAMNEAGAWLSERTGIERDEEMINEMNAQFVGFMERFLPFAFGLISAVIGSFAILVLAIFLGAQPEVYRNLIIRVTPPPSRARIARVYDEAGKCLRNWVIGKAISMLAIGIITWIGLLLFGIPGALALAAIAALLEFVPNLGPTIAAIPAIIAAFLISPATALWVAVFYIVLQQIQSGISVPLVERRAVNIPPAALLVWQLMLAIGFGILGLFVATPLLAVIVVAVRILYIEPTEERYEWDRRDATARSPELAGGDATGAPEPAY